MNVCHEMKSQSDCFVFIWINAHLVSMQFGTTLMFGIQAQRNVACAWAIKVTVGGTSFMAGIPCAKSLPWEVVVAQLVERSLLLPEVRG